MPRTGTGTTPRGSISEIEAVPAKTRFEREGLSARFVHGSSLFVPIGRERLAALSSEILCTTILGENRTLFFASELESILQDGLFCLFQTSIFFFDSPSSVFTWRN